MSAAQPYFEGLGFDFPAHQNPADAFLDIVSGEVLRSSQTEVGRGGSQASSGI
jgi:hypothetical protein